ncbi:hypothetical protein CHT98_18170 (plasmid) [Azospirillum brasilense]|uniref:DDE domain-containing protein n=1 Tax=Azospirillum brasilense TaxID=192 RepID=A0A235HAN1_AZOBR|nr:hypothetical protein CHT98_18170 [Azospirillum brasilense]
MIQAVRATLVASRQAVTACWPRRRRTRPARWGGGRRTKEPQGRASAAQGLNNRAEISHQATHRRERQTKRFKSPGQVQRRLSIHDPIATLFPPPPRPPPRL